MEFRAHQLLGACRKRCRKNGTEFSLDVPWMAEKLRSVCELTGLSFDMSVRTRRPQLRTPSIDRIEPGKGYTKDNCRIVLFGVNLWLRDFTLEAIIPIAAALAERYSKAVAA